MDAFLDIARAAFWVSAVVFVVCLTLGIAVSWQALDRYDGEG